MALSARKTALLVASMLIASVIFVVAGVFAITSGSQSSGFTMTYVPTQINATIVATGVNGADYYGEGGTPIDMNGAEAGTTHTASINTSTTSSEISAPTINGGNQVQFAQNGSGVPQYIFFSFQVTSNSNVAFKAHLTSTNVVSTNVSIQYLKSANPIGGAAYGTSTTNNHFFFLEQGESFCFTIRMSVSNRALNASASGNFVLTLQNIGDYQTTEIGDAATFNATSFSNSRIYRQTADITSATALTLRDQCGIYDGGGHTITITGADQRIAIFDYVYGRIQNLNVIITDGVGTSGQYQGGIAHENYGIFSNCSFDGEISFTYSRNLFVSVGGICGRNSGIVSDCYNAGGISITNPNTFAFAGGISGSEGTITNCYNTGSVTATSTSSSARAGGISGDNGPITDCYNTGSITANAITYAYAGGICGSDGTITNCYNAGSIAATSTSFSAYAGGIIASGGGINNCYNAGSVTATGTNDRAYSGGISGSSGTTTNCHNTGSITANASTYAYAGGISGYYGTMTNCYNTGNIIVNASTYARAGGISGYSGDITNCYNLGIVTAPTGATKYIGGISGQSGTCTGCYWASDAASFGKGTGTGTGDNTGATSFAVSATHSYAQGTFAGWTFGTYGTATDGWVWGENKSMTIRGDSTTFTVTSLPRLWWETL